MAERDDFSALLFIAVNPGSTRNNFGRCLPRVEDDVEECRVPFASESGLVSVVTLPRVWRAFAPVVLIKFWEPFKAVCDLFDSLALDGAGGGLIDASTSEGSAGDEDVKGGVFVGGLLELVFADLDDLADWGSLRRPKTPSNQ